MVALAVGQVKCRVSDSAGADRERYMRTSVIAGIIVAIAAGLWPPPATLAQESESKSALLAGRPEPIIFDLMRRLRETPVGDARLSLRRQIEQYRGHAHDESVRVGNHWITAKEMRRRREQYVGALAEAEEILDRIGRRTPRDRAEQLARERLLLTVGQKLQKATRIWGGPLLRNFLGGQAALLLGDRRNAERLFTQCIRTQPLVAGFHQGRAMARKPMNRPLDVVADWVAVSYLRPEDELTLESLETALRDVPGTSIRTKAFRQAKLRLDEIDDPESRRRSSRSRRGLRWLMPGEDWQGNENSLPIPPYDALFVRRAVAVPVTDTGVFLLDAAALKDALELMLEIAPGEYVPAETVRLRSSAIRDLELPLAAIRVRGLEFTPVGPPESDDDEEEDSPRLAAGGTLAVEAISQPAELGAATIRTFDAKVTEPGNGEGPTVDAALRPGEGTAPAFDAEGTLVTFLVGRTDVTKDNGGPRAVLRPTDVATYAVAAAKSGRRRGSGRRSGGRVQKMPRLIEGRSFVLHVIVGKGVVDRRRR